MANYAVPGRTAGTVSATSMLLAALTSLRK